MRLAVVSFSLLALGGCLEAVHGPDEAVPSQSKTVAITTGDEITLNDLIAAHQGEVVFVDYWATWCHPCVEFFPHTVELSRKFKERGMVVISVAFDAPDEIEKVRGFLVKQGADFENLICRYEPGSEAFEKFAIDQVPHFRLYDRQGKLRYKWDEKPEDAEQRIEELLKEKTE